MRKANKTPLNSALLRDCAETLAFNEVDLGDQRACIEAINQRGYHGHAAMTHLEPAIEQARIIRASFPTVGSQIFEAVACIASLSAFGAFIWTLPDILRAIV